MAQQVAADAAAVAAASAAEVVVAAAAKAARAPSSPSGAALIREAAFSISHIFVYFVAVLSSREAFNHARSN